MTAGTAPRAVAQASGSSAATTVRRRRSPERRAVLVALPVAILVILGLGALLSASSVISLRESVDADQYAIFKKQLAYVAVGAVGMVAATRIPYRVWARLAPAVLMFSVVGLIATLVMGDVRGGSRSWIEIGPLTLQASEFAKFGVIAYLAAVLTRRERHLTQLSHVLVPVISSLGVVVVLIMLQPDLGTTLIVIAAAFAVIVASAAPLRHILVLGVTGLAGVVFFAISQPYRRQRLLSFWDPSPDILGDGLQAYQSLVALGTGRIFGVGLGASRARWSFLPNAHTDFIFAIIGEELGLAGSLTVVFLFATFAVAGTVVAARAADPFGRLLAVGIVTWISFQAIVNVGGVVGALPITGVPLPFVSQGGNAMLINLFAAGILVNIARSGRSSESAAGRAGER